MEAWRNGAVLAGASAGALTFGAWALARRAEPGNVLRNARPALGLVAGVVVVPHFATVGPQWVPAIRPAVTALGGILLGLDERTAALRVGRRMAGLRRGLRRHHRRAR